MQKTMLVVTYPTRKSVWNLVGRVPMLMAVESWNSRLWRTRNRGAYKTCFFSHGTISPLGEAKYRWFSMLSETSSRI